MSKKQNPLDSFRYNVCEKDYKSLEDQDYYSLSIGYFLALGLDIDAATKLAIEARYTHNYWT